MVSVHLLKQHVVCSNSCQVQTDYTSPPNLTCVSSCEVGKVKWSCEVGKVKIRNPCDPNFVVLKWYIRLLYNGNGITQKNLIVWTRAWTCSLRTSMKCNYTVSANSSPFVYHVDNDYLLSGILFIFTICIFYLLYIIIRNIYNCAQYCIYYFTYSYILLQFVHL